MGPLRTMSQVKEKKEMVQRRQEENHLQRSLNIHDKTMKHGGLLTRLHRGEGAGLMF